MTWSQLPLGDQVLGESPRWQPQSQELSWVDVFQGTVSVARLSAGAWQPMGRLRLEPPVTSVAPVTQEGCDPGWWVATGDGLSLLSREGRLTDYVRVSDEYPALRTNDMVTDSRGRLLVGLLAEDRRSPVASLVSVGLDGCSRTVVDGVVTANGLALNPDESTLYLIDSIPRTLTAYPYDITTGDVGDGTVIVDWTGAGTLDGMAIASNGDLWVAVWDGGLMHRHSADGTLLEVIRTPVARPTAVCLVGPNRDQVVITTARTDISPTSGHIIPAREGKLHALSARPLPAATASGEPGQPDQRSVGAWP